MRKLRNMKLKDVHVPLWAIPISPQMRRYVREYLGSAGALQVACGMTGYSWHLAQREAEFIALHMLASKTTAMKWIRDRLWAGEEILITRCVADILRKLPGNRGYAS